MAAPAPLNPQVVLQDRPVNLQSPPPVNRGGPISDQQISEQVIFTHTVKKMRRSQEAGIPTVTDNELATAVRGEHELLDAATVNHGDIHATLQSMQAQLRNIRRIQLNGKQVCGDHPLVPLEVENSGGPQPIGTRPALMSAGGIFPDTVSRLEVMTGQELDTLKIFYHDDFDIGVADRLSVRINKFRIFVGR